MKIRTEQQNEIAKEISRIHSGKQWQIVNHRTKAIGTKIIENAARNTQQTIPGKYLHQTII